MPILKIHVKDKVFQDEVEKNSNIVVKAGIKKFPFPHLKYRCGMASCGICICKVLSGKENLTEPEWKEKKLLKDKIDNGFRLACQFRILGDVEITQDQKK